MSDDIGNKFKVRLVPVSALVSGDTSSVRDQTVAFDVTPQFSESRTVDYSPITPVHMPGAIQVYKHTNSRNFEISASLISRNMADALKNMAKLQVLRSWQMPYFGATSTLTETNTMTRNSIKSGALSLPASRAEQIASQGVQLRGAPPDVLYLYAYSTDTNNSRSGDNSMVTRVNINRVPVVLTSLSISFPDDVDYIPVYNIEVGQPPDTAEPFARKVTVTLSLVETHSPREYENFDLAKFKKGNLIRF